MTNTERRFLVAREGNDVIVREIVPGASAHSHTRADAWGMAQRLAQPVKHRNASNPRPKANRIVFIDLDFNRRILEVETPAAPAQAELPQPVQTEECPEYAYLRKLNLDGKLNTFTASLHEQLERRGSLSERQRECLRNSMEKDAAREQAPQRPDVPAGHYAVENEHGELRFYRVDRPTEGRWAGYTFVKVQASDELHPIKGNAANVILNKIKADPKLASIRYGLELGKCGICNRTLTDEDSRKAGIGPICAGKVGW